MAYFVGIPVAALYGGLRPALVVPDASKKK